jgi:hypothetical protein
MRWKARIRLAGGRTEEVIVEASTTLAARYIIEQLYGAGSIITGPTLARDSEQP